jgi:hypothetical protein
MFEAATYQRDVCSCLSESARYPARDARATAGDKRDVSFQDFVCEDCAH